MQEQFYTFLNTGRYEFVYCHSPEGDAAVVLSDTAFYTIYIQSPEDNNATSLAPLSDLVKSIFHFFAFCSLF